MKLYLATFENFMGETAQKCYLGFYAKLRMLESFDYFYGGTFWVIFLLFEGEINTNR